MKFLNPEMNRLLFLLFDLFTHNYNCRSTEFDQLMLRAVLEMVLVILECGKVGKIQLSQVVSQNQHQNRE